MNKSRQIAIVGSGVSGTVAAWLLRDQADVTLFEAERRFGGHTHTVTVREATAAIPVDTGFMVFNRPNYPLLSALFDHLGVATYPTDMSFSASFDGGRLEYAGSDLNTLFGQRRNLLRPRFWGMLRDILRFNRAAERTLGRGLADDLPLEVFLDRLGLGRTFRDAYLYPMAAAIWSCPRGQIARFPTTSFLRFFANHGLVRLADRPQWETVDGGSRSYLDRLLHDLGPRAHSGARVVRVQRSRDGVTLMFADGQRARFDDVVLACHSDQALALLGDPSPNERHLLGAIRYQPNRVLLHRDPALMPRERRVWSSWNYISDALHDGGDGERNVSVTYWMNSLQRLPTTQDYFVSLNPTREPRADSVVDEFVYEHPVFDADALRAQRRLHRLQGRSRTWYAGAWTGYGFHEDGMRSAVEVAAALGADVPWDAQVRASRDLISVPQPIGEAA
ncbi:MAG: FAD-dependent oxidoreductase [Gammaproteobacteria bacterium]|nr:FAD-dependent oxidoreductase [Gammaproteobacteria bacterium]